MWGNSGIVTCVPFFLDQAIGVEGGMPAVGLSEHSTRFFLSKDTNNSIATVYDPCASSV